MPIYEFRAKDNPDEYAERYYTVGDSPLLYSEVEFDGRVWVRIPSVPGGVKMESYEFKSMQERRWDPDAPNHVPRGQPFEGAPVFRTKAEVDEFRAKKRHKENRELVWGEWTDGEV